MSPVVSHLSQNPPFGFDLVVGVTQRALNSVLKEYLANVEGQEVVVCYSAEDEQTWPSRTDFAALVAAASGADPFAVPDGTDPTDPRVKALQNAQFRYAFRVRFGVNEDLPPSEIPSVIRLDKGDQRVTFQLFFADLEIAMLRGEGGNASWVHMVQDVKHPWIFAFDVPLGFAQRTPDEVGMIDDQAVARMRSLSGASTFAVQQLYVDLSSAALEASPTIVGLDSGGVGEKLLHTDVLAEYWSRLRGTGDVVLGYVVKPDGPVDGRASLIPTGVSMGVSPHVGESGTPDGNDTLSTLNYLIMSGGRPVPAAVPFPWNWVRDGDQAHGAMAVNRSVFAGFLRDLLMPSIRSLCVEPHVRTWSDNGSFSVEMSVSPATNDPDVYTVLAPGSSVLGVSFGAVDGFSPLLNFTWNREAGDESRWAFTTQDGKLRTSLNAIVSVWENRLRIEAYLSAEARSTMTPMNLFGAGPGITNGGRLVDRTATIDYELSVGPTGWLQATATTPPGASGPGASVIDNSEHFDADSIFTGDLTSLMERLRSQVVERMEGLDGAITTALAAMGGAWVFPGGRTFVFKNVGFSDRQDLVAQLTYLSPDGEQA